MSGKCLETKCKWAGYRADLLRDGMIPVGSLQDSSQLHDCPRVQPGRVIFLLFEASFGHFVLQFCLAQQLPTIRLSNPQQLKLLVDLSNSFQFQSGEFQHDRGTAFFGQGNSLVDLIDDRRVRRNQDCCRLIELGYDDADATCNRFTIQILHPTCRADLPCRRRLSSTRHYDRCRT